MMHRANSELGQDILLSAPSHISLIQIRILREIEGKVLDKVIAGFDAVMQLSSTCVGPGHSSRCEGNADAALLGEADGTTDATGAFLHLKNQVHLVHWRIFLSHLLMRLMV